MNMGREGRDDFLQQIKLKVDKVVFTNEKRSTGSSQRLAGTQIFTITCSI